MLTHPLHKLLITAVVCALLGLASPALRAQDEETPPAEPDTVAAEAIEMSELISKSTETSNALRDIRTVLTPSAELAKVELALPGVEEEMNSFAFRDDRPLDDYALHHLEEMRQQWERYRTQVDAWNNHCAERTRELSEVKTQIDGMTETWQVTRDGYPDDLPEEVTARVDDVFESLHSAAAAQKERIDWVLTLQVHVDAAEAFAEANRDSVSAAVNRSRGKLFTLDHPPIWRLMSYIGPGGPDAGAKKSQSWVVGTVKEFMKTVEPRVFLQGSLLLLLLIVFIIGNRKSRSWPDEDAELKRARTVLARPVAAALVGALIFTGRFYPHAPVVVIEVAAVLLLPALARLLPALLPKPLLMPIYGMFGLFVINRVMGIMVLPDYVSRVGYLIVNLLALFFLLVWGRATHRVEPGAFGRMRALERIFSWIFGVALVAAVIENVIGAVALSMLMINGVLLTAYVGILLLAGLVVMQTLVILFYRTPFAVRSSALSRHAQLIKKRTYNLLYWFAVFVWVWTTLDHFKLLETARNALVTFLGESWTIGTITISIGSVLAFFLTLWLATVLSRFVRFVLNEDILPRARLARGVPATISLLVNYVIVGVGFLIALAAAGIELSQFTIIFGAFGVGLGFGMQTVVNNFVSGLILMFERPVQIGDTIEIQQGALIGVVRRIGIRASTIRTFSGAEVIVPNGNLIAEEVVNWTLSDMLRRVEIDVGVAYGTDPNQVIEILNAVANDHAKVMDHPEPVTLFNGFGDSSLDFQMRFWTGEYDRWRGIQSEVTLTIYAALKDAGIEIPFPQRDLHVRSVAVQASGALETASRQPPAPRHGATPGAKTTPAKAVGKAGSDAPGGGDEPDAALSADDGDSDS